MNEQTTALKEEKKPKPAEPTVLPPALTGDLRQFMDMDVTIAGVYVPQLMLPDNVVQLVGFRGVVLQERKNFAIVRLTAPLFARKPEKTEGYVELKIGDHLLVPHGSVGLSAFEPDADGTGEHVFEIVFLPLGRASGEWKNKVYARKLIPAEIVVQRLTGARWLLSPGGFFEPTNLAGALQALKSLGEGNVAVP